MTQKNMTVCFLTNYLTHHQEPFCLELNRILGTGFILIETDILSEERVNLGYQLLGEKYPFVINVAESEEKKKEAMRIALESDVVIIGSAPDRYIKERMKKNKLTFRCAERIFKKGRIDPLRWLKHTAKNLPYRNKNMYYLLNSAYAAKDFVMCGAKRKKMYTWGYFPEYMEYNLDKLLSLKKTSSILWVGRFIKWKHPDVAIMVADRLKKDGYEVHLTIVGTGEMERRLKKETLEKHLEGCVDFVGAVPADQVRSYMKSNKIFLFTSDKREGWGAVVNEAMNSGCAVVACSAAGAVPCMITNNQNGLTYENGDYETLYLQVKRLMDTESLCKNLGTAAYETIRDEWNAQNATIKFIKLVNVLQNDFYFDNCYREGVASPAKYL